MSKLLNVAVLGLFIGATTLVGCRASAEVEGTDDMDRNSGKSTMKKTTIEPDGDRKVTTETKTY